VIPFITLFLLIFPLLSSLSVLYFLTVLSPICFIIFLPLLSRDYVKPSLSPRLDR